VPDRARYLSEITRVVYDTIEVRSPSVVAFLQSLRHPPKRQAPAATGDPADGVPLPLTAEIWSDAIFKRRVPREAVVAAIVSDREAALLCHGLSRLDDETLAFLASHPSLLAHLYERSAPLFAAFAGALRIHDNRVVPPGGPDAAPLWEAVRDERLSRADRCVAALFDAADGRVAYLYDLIGQLDPARRAFVIGAWMPADAARAERFRLLTAGLSGIREWHVRTLPFGRPSYDFGMAVARLAVDRDGRPLPPASRGLWARVLALPDTSDDQPIDAAWIAEHIAAHDVRVRAERIDQIGFAQRVFTGGAGEADALFALRSLPRFRALALTFERAGIRDPATYAAVMRHAARLTPVDGRRGYVIQGQLQGSLALITRMMIVRTLDVATGDRLIQRLAALPASDASGYAGGVARWLRDEVHPVLPPARDLEAALVAALSGPASGATDRRVSWEGQLYRLDLAAAEQNRLRRVRTRQDAPAIDLPLQLAEAARVLASGKATIDDLEDVASQCEALAADLPNRSREDEADNVPAGVAVPPPLRETLKRAAEDLTRATRNKDPRRAPRIAEPLVELADDLLARNLLSFAYAVSLGDPDGTVLLADDVSHRHDFGLGPRDGEMRARITWAIPRQDVSPNAPWHVTGSVLGLDVALATLSLRRVATDHPLEAPKLTSNARDTFAASVSLLDPAALTDADRDDIAAALARGRADLERIDAAGLERLAGDLDVDGARRRALRWTLAHEGPHAVATMFSATELLALGGAAPDRLHAWGMAVVAANGSFCSRLLPPGAGRTLAGRPQLGVGAALMPDVNLRVAMVLKDLGLPAALARVVLSAAMQDFIDEARPTDDGDWLSLSRKAWAIPRERVEDYVAAATAAGPLVPDPNRSPEPIK
jgi:hypothetical protein